MKINLKLLLRSTASSILLGYLAMTFYPSPHDYAFAESVDSGEVVLDASRIRSVSQMINQVHDLLTPSDICSSRSCNAVRLINVCSSVEALNSRVNGRILQRSIRSRNLLPITASQLQLFRAIWQQCRSFPAHEVFIGTEGTVRLYAPQRCRDGNRVLAALRLPTSDCSYER